MLTMKPLKCIFIYFYTVTVNIHEIPARSGDGENTHTHTHTQASPWQGHSDLKVPFPRLPLPHFIESFATQGTQPAQESSRKQKDFHSKVPTMYSTGRLMLKTQSGVDWCYFKQKAPLWSFVQYCTI